MGKLLNMVFFAMCLAFIAGLLLAFGTPYALKSLSIWIIEYLIFFAGISVIIAFLFFRKRSATFFKLLKDNYGYGIVFLTSGIFFNSVLLYLGFSSVEYVTLFTFLSGFMVVLYKWTWEKYLNVWTVWTSIMWAAWIGSTWSFETVILIFGGMCVYDIWAVFRTKVMKKLVLSVLTAKSIPPMFLTDMDIQAVRERLSGAPSDPNKVIKGRLLGNGDLILGGMFPVAVAISYGIPAGILVLIGEAAGMWLNFYVIEKRNVGLPALPLIFGSELAFFLFVLLNQPLVILPVMFISYYLIDSMAIRQARKIKDKLAVSQAI